MKRIITFFFVFMLLSGCASKNDNWKTVDMDNCGSLKIPQNWKCIIEDDLIYILDQNTEPIMIEYKDSVAAMSNKYFSNFYYKDFLSSAVLSNGAIYGKAIILHEDKTKELLFLNLGYGNTERHFLVWDETLDINELEEIAATFTEYL